jgi:hypothetical protein
MHNKRTAAILLMMAASAATASSPAAWFTTSPVFRARWPPSPPAPCECSTHVALEHQHAHAARGGDARQVPSSCTGVRSQVEAFVQRHSEGGGVSRRIVLVTSGGTTVPLEKNTVRPRPARPRQRRHDNV